MSCATSGATIRYTTNGSDPTSSSTVYSGPLTLSATTTLKARAFKSGMTDSAVASGTYTKQAQVTYPTASGIKWTRGSSYTITWTGFPGSNVKIELYKGSSLNTTLSTSTGNNGSFSWTVPTGQALGTDYRIKVTSTSDTSKYDYSDNYFEIARIECVITVSRHPDCTVTLATVQTWLQNANTLVQVDDDGANAAAPDDVECNVVFSANQMGTFSVRTDSSYNIVNNNTERDEIMHTETAKLLVVWQITTAGAWGGGSGDCVLMQNSSSYTTTINGRIFPHEFGHCAGRAHRDEDHAIMHSNCTNLPDSNELTETEARAIEAEARNP
jgi:hypothetical protein